ncbi:hypothetical protein QZH41_011803, partial [Actinostola sp. cb2023]
PNLNGSMLERMQTLFPSAYPLLIAGLCVDALFVIDILLNFRTTYVEEGEVLVTKPIKIAIYYMKSYFVVDLVAAIPWELLIDADLKENTTLFSLLKTARLLRLFRAARKLDRNYEYMTSLLFLMLMFFMLVAHWMACAWYAIGFTENKATVSWLYKLAEENNQPFNQSNPRQGPLLTSRYLTSLYYVMTLCTTVGFGNVSANTDYERIFTICGMVLGAVMYAGIFGNVTAIIHGQYSSNFRYRKEAMAINEFIHFFKVRNPLARRLREYSRHTWSQTKGTDMNKVLVSVIYKVLMKFPEGLQYEIHLHMHLTVLSDSFLFLDAESSCLRSISMRMRRHHHLPGHYILYEGDEVDTLHLIKRGKIEILIDGNLKGRMVEGNAFGTSLRQAALRTKSVTSLRASTCVDCHVIKIKELNDVLQSYSGTRESMLRLMDAADQWPLEEKEPINGDMQCIQSENESRRKHIDSESRHFITQTFKLRPIFGCKMGDTSSLQEEPLAHEESKNAEYLSRVHSPRFVNITDLRSAIRPENMESVDFDEEEENESDEDFKLAGYEVEENDEPVLTDIQLTCSDCENDKNVRKSMQDKVREMSDSIRRLESKVDTLLNALVKQGNDESSLVDVEVHGHDTTSGCTTTNV